MLSVCSGGQTTELAINTIKIFHCFLLSNNGNQLNCLRYADFALDRIKSFQFEIIPLPQSLVAPNGRMFFRARNKMLEVVDVNVIKNVFFCHSHLK